MVAEKLLNQYAECLERYFQAVSEVSQLEILDEEVESVNQQTMESLTIVGQRLHNYLTPFLKEK